MARSSSQLSLVDLHIQGGGAYLTIVSNCLSYSKAKLLPRRVFSFSTVMNTITVVRISKLKGVTSNFASNFLAIDIFIFSFLGLKLAKFDLFVCLFRFDLLCAYLKIMPWDHFSKYLPKDPTGSIEKQKS